MKNTGYLSLWDVEWIFIEESDGISLIPKNRDDIKKIKSHFEDKDFLINFNGSLTLNSIAFIERVHFGLDHTIKLYSKYIISRCHTDSFSGFEVTGEAIDDFFSPSHFFYDRHHSDAPKSIDYIYSNEVADKWTVTFENKPITITLSYGDILKRGVASDLMLHPKLTINFEQTSDTQYIYRAYLFVLRFLKIIRYDTNCGKLNVNLFSKTQDKLSYNGILHDKHLNEDNFCKSIVDIEYTNYKSYINIFLQFAADNPDYTFFHYPTSGIRFQGMHYSATNYINIFAAFEAECHAESNIFELTDEAKIQNIKNKLIKKIDDCSNEVTNQEETDFLKNAHNRILQLGTQIGQSKKIIIAYQVLHKALDNSIKNIFYLPEFRITGPIDEKSLKIISSFLASQRGSITHGDYSKIFSDLDAQKIQFLEILTYSMTLKRAGITDKDIERIIGIVFGCNQIAFMEKFTE